MNSKGEKDRMKKKSKTEGTEKSSNKVLFLDADNGLLALWYPVLEVLLFGMFPDILLLCLPRVDHNRLSLGRSLDRFRNIAMTVDTTDLGDVCKLLLELLGVFEVSTLTIVTDAHLFRGPGLPEADVAVVGARDDEFVVHGVDDREDALHTVGVVDVPGVALAGVEETDCAIVGSCNDLFSCWRVVHRHAMFLM